MIAAKAYRPSELFGNSHLDGRGYWEAADGTDHPRPALPHERTPRAGACGCSRAGRRQW